MVSDVKFRPIQEKNEQYQDLCRGIRIHGVLLPILLRDYINPETKNKVPGLYELCDGQQRLGGSKLANLETIPAQIDADMSDDDLACRQILLNMQRVKPTLTQVMSHCRQYMFRHPGKDQQTVANDLGFTAQQLGRILKQENLTETAMKLVDTGKIKPSAAYVLSTLPKENQEDFMNQAMSMPIDEFTHTVTAEKKALKAANGSIGKKTDVIVPIPLKRVALINLWEVANDRVEKFEKENPHVLSDRPIESDIEQYIKLQEQYHMLQVILQIDPETRARKEAEKAEKKSSAAVERAEKKRREAEEILNRLKDEQKSQPIVESLA